MKIINTYQVAQNPLVFEKMMLEGLPRQYIYMSPGGGDIDPTLYDKESMGFRFIRSDVDHREFRLIQLLLERKQPLLGICRGHQLICAAAGGKLIQDLVMEGYVNHSHGPVFLPAKSLLKEVTGIKGSQLLANSLHHQAIHPDHVPEGWYVSAWSDDGVIEGIAHPDLPVISIQWHPEMGMYVDWERPVTQIQLMYLWLNQFTTEEKQDEWYSLLGGGQEFNPPYLRRSSRPRGRRLPLTERPVYTPVSRQFRNPNQVREYGIGSASQEGVQPSISDSNSE